MSLRDDDVLLRCDNLVQLYDTPHGRIQAVRGVDLAIGTGTIVAVVGPSGCGKSSLLRMLSGIDRPTAGTVALAGIELSRLSDRARARVREASLTHVFQRPGDNLFDHLTASQQLERVMRRRGGESKADEILESLGLAHCGPRLPRLLSAGERQRLAFGRAIAADHKVVIADEPTAHLDGDATALVLDAMDQLIDRDVTIVVATHDARVIDRVHVIVSLRDGAVATVTEAGSELSVIDRSGRIQLPPSAQGVFADRRARMTIDAESGTVVLERP